MTAVHGPQPVARPAGDAALLNGTTAGARRRGGESRAPATIDNDGLLLHAAMGMLEMLNVARCPDCETLRYQILAWVKGHTTVLVHAASPRSLTPKGKTRAHEDGLKGGA